jgi:uncharacterized protein YndB with AHSA1/START domain
MAETDKIAGISSEAVKAKTGKSWAEWLKILDKAGARKMSHTKIAAYLYDNRGVPGWWCQMVAVGYEQARGLRVRHQTIKGFEISKSITIAVPVKMLFEAFKNDKTRTRWLPEKGVAIRKATPYKSMRVNWSDGKTLLSVNFYPKGTGKSQIVVQHLKLASATEVKQKQGYWSKALEKLKNLLEN